MSLFPTCEFAECLANRGGGAQLDDDFLTKTDDFRVRNLWASVFVVVHQTVQAVFVGWVYASDCFN